MVTHNKSPGYFTGGSCRIGLLKRLTSVVGPRLVVSCQSPFRGAIWTALKAVLENVVFSLTGAFRAETKTHHLVEQTGAEKSQEAQTEREHCDRCEDGHVDIPFECSGY
jgi:hypothetical protein